MRTSLNPRQLYRGSVQGFYVPESPQFCKELWLPATPPQHNDPDYQWSTILQRLLRNVQDGLNYHIGGMYIEFDNSGAAVDPTPTIDRGDGLDYYDNLANPQDYLRVPIAATEESSSDETNWPLGNTAHFYAQTSGSTGVHGLTFSDAANSRVYGGALVAFCDEDDASQDLIFARFYFASANQLLKPIGKQIGLLWKPRFL